MDKFYVEHEFCVAASCVNAKVLKSMKAPVEQRPEGTLTAVTRKLYNRGELVPNGKPAPSILSQLINELEAVDPKYVAFYNIEKYSEYDPEEGKTVEGWKYRYAYIK